MKTRITRLAGAAILVGLLGGCSTGDLRMLNDAMAAANGYEVEYPNQRDCRDAGDLRICTGVEYGSGFYEVRNRTSDYCKGYATLEDGSKRWFRLDPYATSNQSISVYNWEDETNWICDPSRDVFDAELRDDGYWYF